MTAVSRGIFSSHISFGISSFIFKDNRNLFKETALGNRYPDFIHSIDKMLCKQNTGNVFCKAKQYLCSVMHFCMYQWMYGLVNSWEFITGGVISLFFF